MCQVFGYMYTSPFSLRHGDCAILLLAPTPPASTLSLSLSLAAAAAVAVAIGLRLYSKILFVFMVFVSSQVWDCDEEVELE